MMIREKARHTCIEVNVRRGELNGRSGFTKMIFDDTQFLDAVKWEEIPDEAFVPVLVLKEVWENHDKTLYVRDHGFQEHYIYLPHWRAP